MVRHKNKWVNTLIIKREILFGIFQASQIGTIVKESLILYVSFQDKKIECSKVDFAPFIDDFSEFPEILH